MEIIRVTLNDLELLVPAFDAYRRFYNQQGDIEGARQFLKERISQNQSVIFMAVVSENNIKKAAGFTQLYPSFSSVSMNRHWILNDLFVDENYRKQGIAQKLIDAAKSLAIETNAVGLTLETDNTNFNAQKLYEKTGWYKDELHYFYHWHPDK